MAAANNKLVGMTDSKAGAQQDYAPQRLSRRKPPLASPYSRPAVSGDAKAAAPATPKAKPEEKKVRAPTSGGVIGCHACQKMPCVCCDKCDDWPCVCEYLPADYDKNATNCWAKLNLARTKFLLRYSMKINQDKCLLCGCDTKLSRCKQPQYCKCHNHPLHRHGTCHLCTCPYTAKPLTDVTRYAEIGSSCCNNDCSCHETLSLTLEEEEEPFKE